MNTHKTRILDVVYNASNNELVRTKTLVKNAIVQVDATPFRQWYEQHYGVKLHAKKKGGAAQETAAAEVRIRLLSVCVPCYFAGGAEEAMGRSGGKPTLFPVFFRAAFLFRRSLAPEQRLRLVMHCLCFSSLFAFGALFVVVMNFRLTFVGFRLFLPG